VFRHWLYPSLLIPALAMPSAGLAASKLTGPVEARVVEVVDGDTLAVRATVWLDQEVITRVRLEGIDTPESRSTCATEKAMARAAKDKLAGLVRDAVVGQGTGTITLYNVVYDKYGGRVRAQVKLADGTDVSEALIRAGAARAYRGGKRQPWCGVADAAPRSEDEEG
jgi:endonuclease YncB( thermonuclease family)